MQYSAAIPRTIPSFRDSDFLVGSRNFCRPEEERTMKKKKKTRNRRQEQLEEQTQGIGERNTNERVAGEQKGVKAKLARVWRVQRREIKGRTNAVRELDVIQSRSVVPS